MTDKESQELTEKISKVNIETEKLLENAEIAPRDRIKFYCAGMIMELLREGFKPSEMEIFLDKLIKLYKIHHEEYTQPQKGFLNAIKKLFG